jgi:hypothetical protein
MNKKIFSVISMALGISLSCITNLLTGDNSVLAWFDSNKAVVVVSGLILTLASLIVAYFSESEAENNGKATKLKLSFFTNLITNFFASLVTGALVTLIVIYGLGYFELDEKLIVSIAILLVGASVGSEFRFVGGYLGTGIIAGAFLSFAFTYYFPESISIPFLPDWANQYPVIPNAFFSAIIGMYTGIYKKSYTDETKLKQQIKDKNELGNSQRFYTLREKLEQQEYYLFANNMVDDMKRQRMDILASFQKIDSEVSEELLAKENDKSDMNAFKVIMKLMSEMYRKSTKTHKFKSPYYIYDSKGNNKFFSDEMDEVLKFAELLLDRNNTK